MKEEIHEDSKKLDVLLEEMKSLRAEVQELKSKNKSEVDEAREAVYQIRKDKKQVPIHVFIDALKLCP